MRLGLSGLLISPGQRCPLGHVLGQTLPRYHIPISTLSPPGKPAWVRNLVIFIGQESGWSWTWQAGVLRKEWRGHGSHDGSRVLQSEGQEERGPVGAGDPGQAKGTRAPSERACIPFGLFITLIVWMPG